MEVSCGRTRWRMSALWSLVLCGLLAVSGERYVVHHDAVSFEHALRQCSRSQPGGGVLTTLATQREIEAVLAAVSPSLPSPGFWLGLRKNKTDCVVPHLPLRGYRWTEDGSEATQLPGYRWKVEPPKTCNLRCAMLSVESQEDWGLSDSSCGKKHPFICKYGDAETDGQEETPDVGADSASLLPATLSPDARPGTTLTPTSTPAAPTSPPPRPPTQPPQAPPTQPTQPTQPPPPPASSPSSQPQPHHPHHPHHPGAEEEKGDCRPPLVNGSRSLRQHPDAPGRMTLECWSGEEVELQCSAASTGGRWEVATGGGGARLDQLEDVCGRCEDGHERDDASWTCRDVDECPSAPCRPGVSCLNTPGSYRCVCYDARGEPHDEGSAACAPPPPPPANGSGAGGDKVETVDGAQSGILVPVLIAVMVLAVLLVVVAVAVAKCCLMKKREAKQRAVEEDSKVAMDATAGNKDAMETTNEKEAM